MKKDRDASPGAYRFCPDHAPRFLYETPSLVIELIHSFCLSKGDMCFLQQNQVNGPSVFLLSKTAKPICAHVRVFAKPSNVL